MNRHVYTVVPCLDAYIECTIDKACGDEAKRSLLSLLRNATVAVESIRVDVKSKCCFRQQKKEEMVHSLHCIPTTAGTQSC